MNPITAQTTSPASKARERDSLDHEDGHAHRHQREHRSNRQVELAADHQDCDADGDEARLRQNAEYATKVVLIEEHAIRADLENHHQKRQQDQSRQFRLFQIGLEEAFQGRLQEFEARDRPAT